MSQVVYPFNIADGDPANAGPVMANFQSVASVVNGGLQLGTNVSSAPPSAQTGAAIAEGSSQNAARADHQHAIRGFEQLTADPTTNNFVGRVYMNTGTSKIRMCISAAGSGSYIVIGNVTASDLVAHQANHVGGGSDLLSPPRVQLTRTSSGGMSNASITAVDFTGSEVYDTDTMHDTATHSTRITFTHGGTYDTRAACAWAANGTGARYMSIQLNGTGQVLAGDSCDGFGSGDNPILSCSVDYAATAGDYIELYVFQNSGGTLDLLGTNSSMVVGTRKAPMSFSARWVSA